MRNRFDQQLELLNQELIEMGMLIERAIENASTALASGDYALAKSVVDFEKDIDDKEYEIEGLCLKLLLMQQPVARDLRQISSALKMITDMERIGDQASDIAEIVMLLNGRIPENQRVIVDMANTTISMVKDSIDAFVRKDSALAEEVIGRDDEVDAFFLRARETLIQTIASDPQSAPHALDLFMVAKYLERIGDHAVNIAEWVVFSITGMHVSEEMNKTT